MSKKRLNRAFLYVAFAGILCAAALGQSNYKVIHSFSGYPNDGMHPIRPVIFDKAGSMYGTAPGGGSQTGCGDLGCGVVYELAPDGQGSWTETILYNFCQNFNGLSCLDGAYPTTGLTADALGNFYGMTYGGGTGLEGEGGGVAFELSPPNSKGGEWSETILYNFCSNYTNSECLDGLVSYPERLVFDHSGNLYGTTVEGGIGHVRLGEGIVFELSPGDEGWTETVLHNFCVEGSGNDCPDGAQPSGGVTFDAVGNLYGTAAYSGDLGKFGGGTLYELSCSGPGWRYQTLASIPTKTQPSVPEGVLSFDSVGNLYGTLGRVQGGVFRIGAKSKKLSLFKFNGSDGGAPIGGLYINPKTGMGYSTTSGGGTNGGGTVFGINASGHESVLYNFCSQTNCVDGNEPWVMPVPDANGNLYGTTEFGGADNEGVVFEVTP